MSSRRVTSGLVVRLYGVVLFSLMLTGCSGTAKQGASVLECAGKPREALVLNGVSRLRNAFNRGDCQSIFDEAELVFRLSRSQQAWLDECERMRKKLGSWRNFQKYLEYGPGVPLSVMVYGEAEFARGGCGLTGILYQSE